MMAMLINKQNLSKNFTSWNVHQPFSKTLKTQLLFFLAHNYYETFTATDHSSILIASLDVANAQSACHECFLIHTEGQNEQESIASETFESIGERTILFEHSIHDKFY